jgi:hypothetical protein
MKRFLVSVLIVLFIGLMVGVQAADTTGTTAITYSQLFEGKNVSPNLKSYRVDWTSNADGTAITPYVTIKGTVLKVTTYPSDGATSPTANYDITLKDAAGTDLLGSQLLNRSEANVETIAPYIADGATSPALVLFDRVQWNVDNAGAARTGRIRVIVREP